MELLLILDVLVFRIASASGSLLVTERYQLNTHNRDALIATRYECVRCPLCAWQLCLAVVFLVATLASMQPALGRPLRVMTYNIHHSEGLDGVFDLERISDVINSVNPDIVALQELDQGNNRSGTDVFQLDQLAELTGLQGYFGKTINYSGGEYGHGVLISPDITVTRTVNRPLPSPAGGEARAVIEVGLSLDDVDATEELAFFATHFDHASGVNRLAQAAFINDLVSTTPALLAGDLNAQPGSNVLQIIDDEWTNTSAPISQIDYVLYRAIDQWNVLHEGQFIVNPTTQVASDHYPLFTVIDVIDVIEPEPSSNVIIGPVSATTTMGEDNPMAHSYDQSGLSIGYLSGVSDFDAYIASNPTHSSAPGTDWTSLQVAGQADFDLGSQYVIDRAVVWNFNFAAAIEIAIQSVRIITAIDAAFTTGVVDHGIYNLNTFTEPNPAQVLLLTPTQAQFVRLTDFIGNGIPQDGDPRIALGEIAFRQVPEPTTLALAGLGLSFIAMRRKR